MRISVVYAEAAQTAAPSPGGRDPASAAPRVWTAVLELPEGATAGDAVAASGLLAHLPGRAIDELDLGVFNRTCRQDRILEPGDRVEIYRPLLIDPKAARHLRVSARRKAEALARQAVRGAARRSSPEDPGPSPDELPEA